MEQGGEDWHAWRRQGLGASEAAAILGISPFKTRLQLWEEKTGKREPFKGNWATERGNKLEPKARATYELTHNIEMRPILAEHKNYSFIKCSLDGWNSESSTFLEIKCPGKVDHEKALKGEVPEKYIPQLMQIFLITGAKEGHYFSFDGESGHLIVVKPDLIYCEKLLKELITFWDLVRNEIPPEACDRDYQIIRDDKLEAYADEWKRLKSRSELDKLKYEASDSLLKELESKIRNGLLVPRGTCAGLRFVKSFRQSGIDYSLIPQLGGVDIEKYRKAPIETFRISILKDKK